MWAASGVQNSKRFGQRHAVLQRGRLVTGNFVGGRHIFQQQVVALQSGGVTAVITAQQRRIGHIHIVAQIVVHFGGAEIFAIAGIGVYQLEEEAQRPFSLCIRAVCQAQRTAF